MIAQITGVTIDVTLEYVVIGAGGVGYKVFAIPNSLSRMRRGEEIALWTHLAVRENALDLYGFQSKEELEFFELLISISGIGPKSALGLLSVAPAKTLRSAVGSGDTSYLTKVSGIGQKTAQKIVLELKDKLGALESEDGSAQRREEGDALEALKALGYSAYDSREALKKVGENAHGTQGKIRAALKVLGS